MHCAPGADLYKKKNANVGLETRIQTHTIVPKHLARDFYGLSSPDLIQALAFSSFGTMVNYVHREYNEF